TPRAERPHAGQQALVVGAVVARALHDVLVLGAEHPPLAGGVAPAVGELRRERHAVPRLVVLADARVGQSGPEVARAGPGHSRPIPTSRSTSDTGTRHPTRFPPG